jgi:hypothetical protein
MKQTKRWNPEGSRRPHDLCTYVMSDDRDSF